MSKTGKSSFFIGNLDKSGRRRSHSGTARISQQAPAVFVSAAISENRKELTNLIQLGEAGQSLRSARELKRAGQRILDIALESDFQWIGKYYCALAINKRGPEAFPLSDQILEEVADHGPTAYRRKARVALATNRSCLGDYEAALELYQDAAAIAGSRPHEDLLLTFLIRCQTTFISHVKGDLATAVRGLQELMPLAPYLGREHTGLVHQYFNNLVVFLSAAGRLAEASHYAKILRCSPFASAFPEWGRTCAALDLIKAEQPSNSTIFLAREDFTVAEVEAEPESAEPAAAALNAPSLCWMPTSPDADLYTAVDAPDADRQPDLDADFDHASVEIESSFPVETEAALTDAPGNRPVAAALPARAAFLYLSLISERATVRKRHRAGREPFKSALFANREVTSPRARRSERQCRLLAWGGRVPSARAPPGLPISNPIDTPK
jgi:tetratricopeptide (TPR) repeat protein